MLADARRGEVETRKGVRKGAKGRGLTPCLRPTAASRSTLAKTAAQRGRQTDLGLNLRLAAVFHNGIRNLVN